MKYECEVIQDLLPLYQDEVCSGASRSMVEEHLEECPACREKAQKLKNRQMEELIVREKDSVLEKHAKKERRTAWTVGIVTSCILMVPAIICLICNIAIGHALDWFFIVLTALLVVASLLVVPLLVRRNKLLWTAGCFTGSLLLLLLTCCLYTGGDWFFVAAVPSVFGISLVLTPALACCVKWPQPWAHRRGVLLLGWNTFWLYAVIIVCGVYVSGDVSGYWRPALSAVTYCAATVWVIFLIVRYLRADGFVRAGLSVIFLGLTTAFANSAISFLSGMRSEWSIFDADLRKGFPADDGQWKLFNANVMLTVLLVTLLAGCALLAVGFRRTKKGGPR